ncbi:MAG: glycine dehydrogenase [Candidatus Poribacteria bacterium]|nr:MAG: glycine dehydrogenase [Candidatus Poribacteria bacterium]
MSYVPHTEAERREMLQAIGVSSIEELFADIPAALRRTHWNLPQGLSELEVVRHLTALAEKNETLDRYVCFLGAGAYDHYIPAVVEALVSRGEFATAYTPYQPEVSQGTLQAIFEYQSLICELTGMPVANASMYDGASALAEAALLALNAARNREEILLLRSIHPEYRTTVRTYLTPRKTPIRTVPFEAKTGTVDLEALEAQLSDRTAAVLVQYPNFFGCLEPMAAIAERTKRAGALLVVCTNPIALGVLKPPGQYGADIVVGEGQPLGNPIAFGGPYLGFFAVTEALMRRMPGRVVGETRDRAGRRAFVMTLRAREQDIRREKATSNICTNQSLNALAACVYLAALGKEGLREVATLNLQKAHYAAERLGALPGFSLRFSAPFFNEFVLKCSVAPERLIEYALKHQVLAGLPLRRWEPELPEGLLLCVTERRTREEIDRLAELIGEAATREGNR